MRRIDDLEDLTRRAARGQNQIDPDRVRRPPWFVGSNPRLMIAVLGLIGCLLVVRVVSTFWIAQEAWHWWSHRAPPRSASAQSSVFDRDGVGKPESLDSPTTRAAPPLPDAKLAYARLSGNPGQWFGPDAYPADALRANEQGRTVARLGIDTSGTPVSCAIETSSGSRSLDAQTCTIALRRIQFQPPRDARGRPIASTYNLPVRWVLPQG